MSRVPGGVWFGAVSLGLSCLLAMQGDAPTQPGCPPHLEQRTAVETVQQHLDLLHAGRVERAMCDYADDAVLVVPGHVARGLDAIRAGLSSRAERAASSEPHTLTAGGDTVLITFAAEGASPEGVETYIVRNGQIVTQTAHHTFDSTGDANHPVALSEP